MHAMLFSRQLMSRTSARSFASQASARGLQAILDKKPDDVVITFAKRTAMGKAKKGQFKDTPVDELLSGLLKVHACSSLDSAVVLKECAGYIRQPLKQRSLIQAR
jgi:acetyl-CoA acyltransferase 1